MGNETTAELPKLPECFKHPQVYGIGWILYTADQMNAHYLAGVEAGRASRAQSDWETSAEDADGNPLVTVRSDALVALGEFALTPALTSIRVGDERLSRVELTSRLMDAVKCAAPAALGETK